MTYAHGGYQYIPPQLTLLSYSTPHPSLTKSVNMYSHHYARHLPQRSIPCAISPIKPTIIHIFNIYLIRRP
ncbi:CFA_G0017570.mRNA.1.CDS.1 [Saccharomyces cerevisiae]|nr:CFA_G0017570.mRNA.1.CDS.1 [Saccharomyces cerevisiae]CAI7280157.1 CFA_G0017570.mRNA.1.CDS.1 [Saccharomyces cerevisiae]